MRLHVLSDLHTELAPFAVPRCEADVLVLAGDIANGLDTADFLRQTYDHLGIPIVFVPGNHDFYGHSLALVDWWTQAVGPQVHVLDMTTVAIDSVRFLGCTLWTDFALCGRSHRAQAMERASRSFEDFRAIDEFSAEAALLRHRSSRVWLRRRLSEPFAGTTVVVTHHGPCGTTVKEKYAHDLLAASFASDLEELLTTTRPSLWIHGHTHRCTDCVVGNTRIYSNQRGNPRSGCAPGFDPIKVIVV
jgi:Icc-related predicted phosphoesterase